MEEFYKEHGLNVEEVEKELFKKEIFDEILEKFDNGLLTYKGKRGVDIKVTNAKQAYAMACAISEKAWKKRQGEPSSGDSAHPAGCCDGPSIQNYFSKATLQ